MTYKSIIDDRALAKAQDVYNFYETKQIGLGGNFKTELDKINIIIESKLYLFKKIKIEISQALLKKFRLFSFTN